MKRLNGEATRPREGTRGAGRSVFRDAERERWTNEVNEKRERSIEISRLGNRFPRHLPRQSSIRHRM